MVLLSEQIRKLANEEILYNNTESYDQTAFTDWTNKVTKQLTFSEATFLMVKVQGSAGTGVHGAVRCKITQGATEYLALTSGIIINSMGAVRQRGLLFLPSGTWDFEFEMAVWVSNSPQNLTMNYLKIAKLDIADASDKSHFSGSASIANNDSATLINENITVPASRDTALGPLKKNVVFILLYGYIDDKRNSKYSSAAAAGYATFEATIDGDFCSTLTSAADNSGDASNPSYGEGCHAQAAHRVDLDQTVNLKVNCTNKTGATETCKAEIFVLVCPWITFSATDEYFVNPVTLDFPQGSTVYAILEPFTKDDSSKEIRVGKEGKACGENVNGEFYSTISGAGILELDYTFEVIAVDHADLYFGGKGAVVAALGVDIR